MGVADVTGYSWGHLHHCESRLALTEGAREEAQLLMAQTAWTCPGKQAAQVQERPTKFGRARITYLTGYGGRAGNCLGFQLVSGLASLS